MTDESKSLFSRFVYDANKINKNWVHFRAFQPPRDLRLSVQKIDELERDQIQEIGEHVAEKRNQKLKGWGEIEGQAFLDEDLVITVDNDPNKGHTMITGWVHDAERQKNTTKNLAARSRPVLC